MTFPEYRRKFYGLELGKDLICNTKSMIHKKHTELPQNEKLQKTVKRIQR